MYCKTVHCALSTFQTFFNTFPNFFLAGALFFGCTVALCFSIRDLMFYVIGEFKMT